jgi:hypothetical protein
LDPSGGGCRIRRPRIDVWVEAHSAGVPAGLGHRSQADVHGRLSLFWEIWAMKFLMMIKHSESYRNQQIPQALMDAMGEFVGESFKNGTLKDTAGLKPSTEGFRLRLSKGKLKVSDGPFTEAKEVVGGYAIVEVPSKDEALKVARQFMDLHAKHWPEFEGESEVRPLEDF